MSSARIEERLTDGDVVVVHVFGEALLGHGLLGELDISLCEEVVVGFTKCGGVLVVLWDPTPQRQCAWAVVYNLKEGEGQEEVLEAKDEEEEKSEVEETESQSTCA